MLRYHLKASGGIYPVITIADVGFRGCNGTGFEAFLLYHYIIIYSENDDR